MKRIHWHIVRDAKGEPERLEWSSAHQKACEDREATVLRQEAEEARLRSLPLPSMIQWAEKRGLV